LDQVSTRTPTIRHRGRLALLATAVLAVIGLVAFLVITQGPRHYSADHLTLGTYKYGACDTCGPTQGPAGVDSYASWLGSAQVVYAEDNVGNTTWDFFEQGWPGSFAQWKKWHDAVAARRLVLAVPFFVNSEPGTDHDRIATCARGAFNAHYRALGANLRDAGLGDTVVRIAWEAQGDWSQWSYAKNPTDWRACWRQVALSLKQEAPTLRTNWNVGNDTGGRTDMRDAVAVAGFDNFYPGSDVVDEIGIDTYSVPQVRNYTDLFSNGIGKLGWFVQLSGLLGKPLSFPEWGLWDNAQLSRGDGSRDDPVFIQRMYDFMTDPAHHVTWAAYFDINVDGDMHQLQPDWDKGTIFPQASKRFAELFGSH
jgi:hypothetical protein